MNTTPLYQLAMTKRDEEEGKKGRMGFHTGFMKDEHTMGSGKSRRTRFTGLP